MIAALNTVVLVVGDDSLRAQLAEELDALAVVHRSAETIERGLELLDEEGVDVLFTDLCFPDGVGFELLDRGKDRITTILLGEVDELRAAAEILKYGVADFLRTPIDGEELRAFLRNLQASGRPGIRDGAQGRRADGAGFGVMVGRSPRHAERVRANPADRTQLRTGPDHRRERYWEGARGKDHS